MQALKTFAVVRFVGNDTRAFLQGQFSNDLQLLTSRESLLASCNSAQGRVQAIVTLVERRDGVVALLPATMIDTVIARLRKYILRSKVSIENLSDRLQLFAATRSELIAQHLPVPAEPGQHQEADGVSVLRWRDSRERFLLMRAAGDDAANGDHDWQLADIRAGLPQVFPETHELFVAQMLNLDLLGGISFNKGCYTGQEIIARAHFRGAVKRRMFRFGASCAPPAPGARVLANGTHAGEVVISAATASGCELLAVLHLSHRDQTLEVETRPGVVLQFQPLPYALPLDDKPT